MRLGAIHRDRNAQLGSINLEASMRRPTRQEAIPIIEDILAHLERAGVLTSYLSESGKRVYSRTEKKKAMSDEEWLRLAPDNNR